MKLRNLDNSSSRVKNNTLDLVDRISALPDAILSLILSNLPTNNAVATSILSKRWKFIWTTVHNLDFNLEDWTNELPEDAVMKFVQSVDRVLLLLDGEFLNKFRLLWAHRFIPSQVSSWITTIITRNVRDLFVSVNRAYQFSIDHTELEMPASVFNAYSLQCLELCGFIVVPAEIVVCLPSLESLKLVSVYFRSEQDFENLICGCPKLNYLYMYIEDSYRTDYSLGPDVFTFIISSTALRRLEVCVDFGLGYHTIRNLQLKASSLEYLKIDGPISRVLVKESLSSLVEADFRIRFCEDEYIEDNYDPHIEAVRAFDCAKTIILSPGAMWSLSNGTICLSTTFTRLTKLEVEAVFCHCRSLRELIQSSNSLQVLIISQESVSLYEDDYDRLDWTDPVEVPRCLSNSLKEVSFNGYHGFDDEREMIGYMLMHGSVLEVMKVTCKYYVEGYSLESMELLKQISRFPRRSPACILEFIE